MHNEIANHNLNDALEDLAHFSKHDKAILSEHFHCLSLEKGDYLIKDGQTCRSIYFVAKGGFRHYYINDNGTEVTQNLFVEKDWMLEYKSFTSQRPSTSSIQATEVSEVFTLSAYDLHKLMKLSDMFFHLSRILQFAVQQPDVQRQITSPKDRYLHILSTKPQIIQRFPLKFIASYLGMTPETLSRVRRSLV